jgi:SSS family solute:Na+ symporter
MFHRIDKLHPEMLTIHAGPADQVWFTTSMLVSAIGVGLMCLPHAWPAVMSARDPKVLRRNYTWMPLYELCLLMPITVGFAAILVLKPGSSANGILLTLSKQVLPAWATGLVVIAAIATAMVPAAGILIGISSLVARNIARVQGERTQFWINHGTVVAACGLSLLLAIFRPDLLANLLLLTYSGTVQLAPAIALGFLARRPVGKVPVLAGLFVGELAVIWLTFWNKDLAGHVNVGLIGLAANLIVLTLAAPADRLLARKTTPEPDKQVAITA